MCHWEMGLHEQLSIREISRRAGLAATPLRSICAWAMSNPVTPNARVLASMEQTLQGYGGLYNHQLPKSALDSKAPMQAMKEWH